MSFNMGALSASQDIFFLVKGKFILPFKAKKVARKVSLHNLITMKNKQWMVEDDDHGFY